MKVNYVELEKGNKMESWEYARKYADQIAKKCEGCSTEYAMDKALSNVFIRLKIYHPEAFKKILELLRLEEVAE